MSIVGFPQFGILCTGIEPVPQLPDRLGWQLKSSIFSLQCSLPPHHYYSGFKFKVSFCALYVRFMCSTIACPVLASEVIVKWLLQFTLFKNVRMINLIMVVLVITEQLQIRFILQSFFEITSQSSQKQDIDKTGTVITRNGHQKMGRDSSTSHLAPTPCVVTMGLPAHGLATPFSHCTQ